MHLGLAKTHHKNHNQRKSGRDLGLGKLTNIWGSPLVFLQRPRCECGLGLREPRIKHANSIIPFGFGV